MLATIHIGSKKFILPGYTVVPFNCSLERSLNQDVGSSFFFFFFFFNYNTFKVVSVRTDRVKNECTYFLLWFRCFVHDEGSISRKHPVIQLRKFHLLYYLGM